MIDLQQAAANWLASQDEKALRIAREIISRRQAFGSLPRGPRTASGALAHESGLIDGLRLALSYLGDRPGDISQTGAEGFIIDVEQADLSATEGPS